MAGVTGTGKDGESGARRLRLVDYDVVGFDIDHTLTNYNVPHLFDTICDSFAHFLVEEKGYDRSLLAPFEQDKDFCTRGVVLDLVHGNFLKLAEDGVILRASHGLNFLSAQEIVDEYGKDRHWAEFEQMIDEVNNLGDRYRVFENFFDMPFMVIAARLVDLMDKKNGGRPDKYTFFNDVIDAANYTYLHTGFAEHNGGFFPLLKDHTSDFIQQPPDAVKTWLKSLKKANKKLFVLTSSFNDSAAFSLRHILGADWKDYFDVICTFAKKPGFFTKKRPFLNIENSEEKDVVTGDLEAGQMYSQGNPDDLMKYLRQATGKDSPKVLFVGDSLRSDIFPSKRHGKWDTLLILEEMVLEKHTSIGKEAEPTTKKAKIQTPPVREKEYLTSAHWGSLFTDQHPCQQQNTVSADHKHRMNTLWGYIIRKYADLVVPQLEYIADYPLDHEFEVFDHTEPFKWGFYPFMPSALVASGGGETTSTTET